MPTSSLPGLAISSRRPHTRRSSPTRRAWALAVAVAAASGATLAAHDFWIEPTTFSPAQGEIVGLRLRVGLDLIGDPVPRDPALVDQFVVVDGQSRKPVIGRAGGDPAGLLRVAAPGLLIVGYQSNPSPLEQTREKFDQYLKEEGLEAVAANRKPRGQAATVREIFSRCAKSLVLSGPPDPAGGDRPLGFTLELTAERNPYAMTLGQDLPVRLTYEGRPLAGALVVAMSRSNPADKTSARSDKDGRVRFRLSHPGLWLIKAVHLTDAPAGAGADWASYWASLTFHVRPSTAS